MSKYFKILNWFKYSLFASVVMALLALVFGWSYQVFMDHQDRINFPPEGKLVNVDGHNMHIHCLGSGSPTVIMEQGLSGIAIGWRQLHEQLAEITQTCAYDRVGYGFSEVLDRQIQSPEVAQILNKLLNNAGINNQLILVGWSAGGVYIRDYYQQFPQNVKGMVFLDSSHEQQSARFPEEDSSGWIPGNLKFKLSGIFGIGRLKNYFNAPFKTVFERLKTPENLQRKIIAQYSHSDYINSVVYAWLAFDKDTRQDSGPESLNDLPIIVISQGLSKAKTEEDKLFEELWNDLQIEIANLSSNSRRIIAEKSGHAIHTTQAELIVQSVQELVELVKSPLREPV